VRKFCLFEARVTDSAEHRQPLAMSWFKTTNLAEFAKTAIKEAQKTIDKALDIPEEPTPEDAEDVVDDSGMFSRA
jgi:hypothetical protein